MKASSLLSVMLGIALLQGAASVNAASQRLVFPYKIPRQGKLIRLRSLYKANLDPLSEGALMTSPALLDKANYENLRDYAQSIMTKYPPDQYYYVGVGRTAGPVIAFLKNVSPHIAANFPSSGMREDAYALGPAHYNQHIEALIPEDVRHGDRKILLIDQSGGRSLRGLRGAFDGYRSNGGAMPEVEMVTLGMQSLDPTIGSIDHAQGFWKDREEVAEYIGEQRDGGHVMHQAQGGIESLKRNPKHAEHRRKLFQRMARDATFDAFLRAQFPTLLK
jgi:hypothetical protein